MYFLLVCIIFVRIAWYRKNTMYLRAWKKKKKKKERKGEGKEITLDDVGEHEKGKSRRRWSRLKRKEQRERR